MRLTLSTLSAALLLASVAVASSDTSSHGLSKRKGIHNPGKPGGFYFPQPEPRSFAGLTFHGVDGRLKRSHLHVRTTTTDTTSTAAKPPLETADPATERPVSPVAGYNAHPAFIPLTADDLTNCKTDMTQCIPTYRDIWKLNCIKQLNQSANFKTQKTYGWFMFKLDTFKDDHISDKVMTVVAACYETTDYDESGMKPGKAIADVTTSVQTTLGWTKEAALAKVGGTPTTPTTPPTTSSKDKDTTKTDSNTTPPNGNGKDSSKLDKSDKPDSTDPIDDGDNGRKRRRWAFLG